MDCRICDFAPHNALGKKNGQIEKMPTICPHGLAWANQNQIPTSDVGVHIIVAVVLHVGLGVGMLVGL